MLLPELFSPFQLLAWLEPVGLVGMVAPEVFPNDIRSFGTSIAAAGLGRPGAIVGMVMFPIMMRPSAEVGDADVL